MRISDWSSDVCSSDLPILGQIPEHHLRVLEQRREFFWIVRSAFEKVPASLVRLSHPPNDSVSINDSTSLDMRIAWVQLMMPEWNHLVGFKVIADEGSLTNKRSEALSAGKECGRTCRSRGWPYPETTTHN